MSIYIYNSLSRNKEPFESIKPGQIKMYVCGPTVYDEPHIGHARSAYIFEVIRRYLGYRGYKVKFVRNVTDVDDKIIDKARKEYPDENLNTAYKKVAEKYFDSYHQALDSLGIGLKPPDIVEPKASEYIKKMIVFIQVLIERGVAYPAGGDVYFDITKAKNYGKLSNQSLDKMESGARVSPTENKRNPLDFALWKSAKENEPFWESPWGKGRPGWHIECSVMSSDILGDEFDIHGGGIDLIFPHHENEVVQSEGAGKKFARYWIHHGLLTINGQKMAKSLGNFVTIKDFLDKYKYADILKLFFLPTHYSNPIDYNEEKIEEAGKQKETFDIFFLSIDLSRQFSEYWMSHSELAVLMTRTKAPFSQEDKEKIDKLCVNFKEALDNDFNTAKALGYLFELIDLGSSFISSNKEEGFMYVKSKLHDFLKIFCLSVRPEEKFSETVLKNLAEMEVDRLKKKFKESDAKRIAVTLDLQKIIPDLYFTLSNTASSISVTASKAPRNK
jgi:cysteinyl-tRNA synthetase